jgi:hypothetical protein
MVEEIVAPLTKQKTPTKRKTYGANKSGIKIPKISEQATSADGENSQSDKNQSEFDPSVNCSELLRQYVECKISERQGIKNGESETEEALGTEEERTEFLINGEERTEFFINGEERTEFLINGQEVTEAENSEKGNRKILKPRPKVFRPGSSNVKRSIQVAYLDTDYGSNYGSTHLVDRVRLHKD